ncbi:MAG TPA: CBS domain-containing protein [Verrucomicrobiae bacterium]|jgi:CBS domain-containing protein|nr:CBS domain-containing protein [Verrucomicrobiae bacterium]
MTAKNIMTSEVVTVSASATVKQAACLLTREQISGAPVIDRQGRIVGILSEADIVAKHGARVKDIMSKIVSSVDEETSIEEMASLMTAEKISRLPVLRGKKLVGIVSRADLVAAVARGIPITLTTPIYDL